MLTRAVVNRTVLRRARGGRADGSGGERGSVVIGVSALMLLVLIGTGLLARGQFAIRTAALETDAVVAQATAEQGIAEVLARLEAGERGDFADTGRTAVGTYDFSAVEVSDTEFRVFSQGEVDGQTHAVEVTIGGEALSEPTVRIDSYASISNNSGTISGLVATNGPITASGTTVGDSVELHGPSARCNNCGPTTSFPDALALPEPAVPDGSTRSCPSDGLFEGVIDGQGGVPLVCRRSETSSSRIRFFGTISVINPPALIYIEEGLDLAILSASINDTGAIEDFQLFGLGDDDYWWFDAWNSKIRGILEAPGRDSLLQAVSIEGSVTAGILQTRSSYDLWIAPDASLPGVTSAGWQVTSYERVPSR